MNTSRLGLWSVTSVVLLSLVGLVVTYVQDGGAALCCIVGIAGALMAVVLFDVRYFGAGSGAGGPTSGEWPGVGASGASSGGHSSHGGSHHHHGGFGGGHTGGGGAGSSWDGGGSGGNDHGGHHH